ncbi:hypothetical protein HDU93_006299, partial [Gonapodya sp. JEL0774]
MTVASATDPSVHIPYTPLPGEVELMPGVYLTPRPARPSAPAAAAPTKPDAVQGDLIGLATADDVEAIAEGEYGDY